MEAVGVGAVMVNESDLERMRPFRNFIENKWTKRCDDAKRIPDVIHDELPKILAEHRIAAIDACKECVINANFPTDDDLNSLLLALEKLK